MYNDDIYPYKLTNFLHMESPRDLIASYIGVNAKDAVVIHLMNSFEINTIRLFTWNYDTRKYFY